MNLIGTDGTGTVAYLRGEDVSVPEEIAFECEHCGAVLLTGYLAPGTTIRVRCRNGWHGKRCGKFTNFAAEKAPTA